MLFDGLCNLLIDFDGTLVLSDDLHDRAFRQVLTRALPHCLDGFRYDVFKGEGTRDVFVRLGVGDEFRLAELTAAKQGLYRAAVAEGRLHLAAGARELLAFCRDAGLGLYLATSGSRASVDAALAATGLAPFFAGVVTGDSVVHGKPAPDIYLACLDRFDLAADASLVVEDAHSGVTAARGAGLRGVGVHHRAIAADCDLFFPNLSGLREELEARIAEAAS